MFSSISSFLDFQEKRFGFLAASFQLGWQTAFYGSRKDLWGKEIFSDQKYFFHHFLTLSWWFSGFRRKKTGRVIKTAFYVCRGTICQKTVFERKQILHFRIFSCKFSDWHLKNLAGLSNLTSASPKEQDGGIIYGEKKIIQTSFRLCERRFQTFAQKFMSRAVKNAFLICRAWFPGNKYFRNIKFYRFSPVSSRTFRTLSDKFLAGFSFM